VRESPPPADRAISELIGMVLLIGLVLLGSTTIVVLGAGALSDAQEQTQTEAAEDHLQKLDSELSTLAASDGLPRAEFDATSSVARDYRIEREGSLNVTVDGNATCSFQQPFSTVVHQDSQGRTVGYEAGGVWRAGLDGSTTVTTPDVTFQDGTLDVRLVNLTGTVDQTTNVAQLNVTRTQNRSQRFTNALKQGRCVRPDNLTIWVNTRFQLGWANYLQSEIGVPDSNVETFSNGSVRVFVPQDFLHPSVDDRTNNVVNLRDGRPGVDIPYMHDVDLNDGRPASIMVNKSANNTYSAFVEPVTDDSLDIGREINIEGSNVTGPPIDATLVFDESGSMSSTDDDTRTRAEEAKEAAKSFVPTLNASRDRIGLVSFDNDAEYRRTKSGEYLTSDFSDSTGINWSIETISDSPNGGTRADRGTNDSNTVHDFKGNESHDRVAILMTDGVNNGCEPVANNDDPSDCQNNRHALDAVDRAANNSITIYTIGFGDESYLDEAFLKEVANRTGGTYYKAGNASQLKEAFKEIGRRIKPENAIASTPMTSNVSTGSRLFDADIPGNTSHIASVTSGSNQFMNINDPTAPRLFSHSFAIEDGEDAVFNLSQYDCQPDAYELTGETRTVNGSTMSVARCTAIGPRNETLQGDIYLDGERPQTLLETSYAPWQDDVNASIDDMPGVDINDTTGDFEAGSNQALVVFDLPPKGSGSRNTLALLVQIGFSEEDAVGADIVTVRVAEANLS
jgi:hypothetical protein